MLHYEIHLFSFLSVMVKFIHCVLRCRCVMCMMSDNIIIADAKCVRCVLCVVYTVWLGDIIIHALCTRYCVNQPIPILTFISDWVLTSASKSSIRRFVITATTAFTFKTLLRHYAKRALTPRSLKVKLGPQRNYHKGRAAIRHYANQTARPLWPLNCGPNFTLRDRGVNTHLV